MTIIKNRPVTTLSPIILAGINARGVTGRESPELQAEQTKMANDRLEAKQALRELVVLAETFGWPEQLDYETREEFVQRRSAELDEVAARVASERAKLAAT